MKFPKRSQYATLFSACLLGMVTIARFLHGGIGVTFWYEMALKIFVLYAAILCDPQDFIGRFLRVVYVMAVISLFFWVFQIIGIPLQKYLFTTSNTARYWRIYSEAGVYTTNYASCSGFLLSSFITNEPMRNVGIYTEPGMYQSVLNSAIFLLLFFSKESKLDSKTIKKYFVVLTIALLSTQSTSGYMGYAVIVLSVLFVKNLQNEVRWKCYAIEIIILAALGLIADFSFRGKDSLLNTAILEKLFTTSGEFSIAAENSTGIYRLATIYSAISAMWQHPLGLGVDGWVQFRSANPLAGPGGNPLRLGAILGVVPFLITVVWIFYPIKYMRKGMVPALVFVFLYFNTALAQTSVVYPALILVPAYVYITRNSRGKENHNQPLDTGSNRRGNIAITQNK